MSNSLLMSLRVLTVEPLTERITRFCLARDDGGTLPPATPGGHVELVLEGEHGVPMHRAYSVVNPESSEQHYEIAVQREDRGSGGSVHVHRLHAGSLVLVRPPVNQFALVPQAARSILIAGGIGITPILSMARHLAAQGLPYRLEYLTRDRESTAYAQSVEQLDCSRLWHDDGEAGKGPALPVLLGAHEVGSHLYVCGPKGLIAAVIDAARALGWPADAVHYELFTGVLANDGDRRFRVTVADSGFSYEVGPGQTILEVLEQAGLPVMADCRRGECGVCMTTVVSGVPDHRDASLTDSERAQGKLICPCVSRSHSDEIVLQF